MYAFLHARMQVTVFMLLPWGRWKNESVFRHFRESVRRVGAFLMVLMVFEALSCEGVLF